MRSLKFDSQAMYREAGREDETWLEAATALRVLEWNSPALPRLPASLTALREIKLAGVFNVLPVDMTPALRAVKRVSVGAYSDAALDAIVGRVTRVTRLEGTSARYTSGMPLPHSVSNLRSLRHLSWELDSNRSRTVAAAAALPALTSLQVTSAGPDTFTAFQPGRTAFPELRS